MSALLQRSESLPQALLALPARRHALFGVPRSPRSCRENAARLQPPAPGAPRRTRELTGVARLSWRRREPGSGEHNRPHYRGRHSHLDKKSIFQLPAPASARDPPASAGEGAYFKVNSAALPPLLISARTPPEERGRIPAPGSSARAPI